MAQQVWLTESLRLTLFPLTALKPGGQWWLKLTGELPIVHNESPRQGIVHEEGPLDIAKLILETQPFRIDCHYAPRDDQSPSEKTPQNVGTTEQAVPSFRLLLDKLLTFSDLPELSRIAFGVNLVSPVESRAVGYEAMSRYVSIKLDAQNSSDFLYQINRPRTIQAPINGLRINRLSRWSVMEFQIIQFQVGPQPKTLTTSGSSTAIRLELDINTAPENSRTFGPRETSSVLPILIDFALELAKKGDIP